MLEFFLKITLLIKILEFQEWRKTAKLKQKMKTSNQKWNQWLKLDLYQLENELANGAKIGAKFA